MAADSRNPRTSLLGALALFGVANAALATDAAPRCPTDLKEVAAEILELDLSGLRLAEKSKCLDPKRFKWIQAFHEPIQDSAAPAVQWLEDGAKVTIDHVWKGEYFGEYSANYTILPGPKAKPIKGSFRLLVETSAARQKKDGCAAPLDFPSPWLVWKKCRP